MKHTARALLAVALLLGVYALAAGVVAGMGYLVYLAATAGSGLAALKFAVIAVLVALALGKGVVSSLRTPPEEPNGVALTPQAQPRLWAEVQRTADQVGVRPPDEMRLVPEVNAAVSEQSRWLGLVPGRRTMYVGAPLLTGLSEDQLRSVLAHELGHYSGRHTALAGISYRGLEAIRRMIGNLDDDSWIAKLFRQYGRLYSPCRTRSTAPRSSRPTASPRRSRDGAPPSRRCGSSRSSRKPGTSSSTATPRSASHGAIAPPR